MRPSPSGKYVGDFNINRRVFQHSMILINELVVNQFGYTGAQGEGSFNSEVESLLLSSVTSLVCFCDL